MANVPTHGRTRSTHGHSTPTAMTGRRTHNHSGYLGPIEGAEQVYEQISVDEAGQVTAGQSSPGAVTGAAFASTPAPVILVHGLPTLPSPNYPVDVFAYDIDAVPKRLYKNVANVWTAAIGPDDIQANSITAGQIAAGAIATSELAVSLVLPGSLSNEVGATPGVFMDSTGLLIRNGKLTLQDEFGSTTMTSSGFTGTWRDFLGHGLYNAAFVSGVNVAAALGRTADLPFWTVARDNAGAGAPTYDGTGAAVLTRAADANMPGGFRVRCTFGALTNNAYLRSDLVPVIPGKAYAVRTFVGYNRSAGSVGSMLLVRWYKEDGVTLVSEVTFDVQTSAVTVAAGPSHYGNEVAPALARYAQIVAQGFEQTTHHASNSVDFGSVSLSEAVATGDIVTDTNADLGAVNVSGALYVAGTASFGVKPQLNARNAWLPARIEGFMVDNPAAGAVDVFMGRFDPTFTATFQRSPVAARAGRVTGFAWRCSTAITAGTIILQIAVASALTNVVTLDSTSGTSGISLLGTAVAFSAGSGLGVAYDTAAGYLPITNDWCVDILVEYEPLV